MIDVSLLKQLEIVEEWLDSDNRRSAALAVADARGELAEAMLMRRHWDKAMDVASVFQVGGELNGALVCGDSLIADGLKWLLAERERLVKVKP